MPTLPLLLVRDFLSSLSGGFTGLALTHLLAREASADTLGYTDSPFTKSGMRRIIFVLAAGFSSKERAAFTA